MPPRPCSSPGYQFCTVEYLICAFVERDQLDDRRVQLVLIAHRRRAAFEVAHVRAFLGDDQRAFELTGLGGVDAEVGRQLHRAAHALRHVHERAVGEHGGVQRREEIVRVGHDASPDTSRSARDGSARLRRTDRRSRRPCASRSLNVVATETLSNTASTATPASRARSCSGMPSLS